MALLAVAETAPALRPPGRDRNPRRREGNGRRRAHPDAHRRTGEEGRQTSGRTLQGHDSEHDDRLQHGARSGGRVPHGSRRFECQAGRTATAQSAARCILDAGARSDVGRVPDVHVRRPGEGEHVARRAGRCAEPSDRAVRRNEFRPRQQRLPRNQHDPACREQVRRVAERQDRRVLPPADRGGMGVRLQGRDGDRHPVRDARRLRLVRRELATGTVHEGHVSQGRHEEAQCVGALRHARQRDGVDAGPVRAVHGGRGGEPVGQIHGALPARRPRRIVERR